MYVVLANAQCRVGELGEPTPMLFLRFSPSSEEEEEAEGGGEAQLSEEEEEEVDRWLRPAERLMRNLYSGRRKGRREGDRQSGPRFQV